MFSFSFLGPQIYILTPYTRYLSKAVSIFELFANLNRLNILVSYVATMQMDKLRFVRLILTIWSLLTCQIKLYLIR